jgi:phosphoglucosamine mutase
MIQYHSARKYHSSPEWEDVGMPGLFGTDGIRGVANRELTPDLVLAVGRAAGQVMAHDGGTFVVGRDTRLRGPMLEGALVAGLSSAGVDVLSAGILPTPGVALLTVQQGARGGAVISASHNPVNDNGVKFFSDAGLKIDADTEDRIEQAMSDPVSPPVGPGVGTCRSFAGAEDIYLEHLLKSMSQDISGLKVVLDCAFGAAYSIGPRAFRDAGADVVAMNMEPDGRRINVDCGSTFLEGLARRVVKEDADVGFAFDGDADRMLAVDETGAEVDGDRILSIAARRMLEADTLDNRVVVATVMSNLGFKHFLGELGIEVVEAPVGDKFVAEAMAATGAVLGGEQSGHTIFARHAFTGDGVLTGLQLAQALAESDEPLSRLAHSWEPYPQLLTNVAVANKSGLEEAAGLWKVVADVERSLGERGRVLVRASGTEPVVRVMVEAADEALAEKAHLTVTEAVEHHLGRRS